MMNNNLEQLKKLMWKQRGTETSKSFLRRKNENWFQKYAPPNLNGIDIGCGNDPINKTFTKWDQVFGDGNAEIMEGVADNSFHTVYTSHLLEHLYKPIEAIQKWYHICCAPGHLIICVPHRDLYEKKNELPSRFNPDHKTFWLPETGEPPCTLGLKETVLKAIPNADIVLLRVLDDGFISNGPYKDSDGEHSIEIIIHKSQPTCSTSIS